MLRAASAAALAGALIGAGCVTTRPGERRPSGSPREVEPGCVAGGIRVGPSEGQPASGRAAFDFWVEADGSPGPIEAAAWEGPVLEGNLDLANRIARAIARCRWVPGTVDGRPARFLVRLPLRFAPSSEAEPEAAPRPGAPEQIRPPREVVPGCIPRTLPLPPRLSAGAVASGTFLVQVEADGSRGPVAMVGRADPEVKWALAEAVAASTAGCQFAPGTVNGQPARTFWLVEVRFAGSAP